jgi:hypothetical protein
MRGVASLGALFVMALAIRARADGSPPAPTDGRPQAQADAPSPAAPVAPAPAAPAPTLLPSDEAAGLHAELARQAASIDDLRASIAEERNERERARESVARVSAYVQVDWVIHNQSSQNQLNGSTGSPLNLDRFTLRRGHVRVEADHGLVSGALEIDANTTGGPQVRPIAAEGSLHWPEKADERLPELRATVGLTQIPFGFEVQELDNVRPFLERSTVLEALFPGAFDLGAKLKVKYRFANLAIGVMNGDPIGDKTFPDLDPSHAKDLVGRVGVDLEIVHGVRFVAGASADTGTGFHPGTAATKYVVVWQDQNGDGLVEPNELTAVGGTAATPSQEFHRFAIAGDARLLVSLPVLGDLAFRAEVVRALNLDRGLEVADPVAAGRDLRELGWYVGATQELTRFGQVGIRYDSYNPDSDASQQRALLLVPVSRRYTTLALMAMLRYERARLVLEYDVNTNPLGISASGAPTTLADNALTLRTQVSF